MSAAPTAEINLNKLSQNWNLLRQNSNATIAPVIKTNAYGFGTNPVSQTLHKQGARNFFVFSTSEALALRKKFPRTCIILLGGLPHNTARDLIANRLLPAISTLAELEEWRNNAKKLNTQLPLVLHFDTGLNRYALTPTETKLITNNPDKYLANLAPALWMSHLMSSENPSDPANQLQKKRFETITRKLPPAPRSLANSCGIALGEKWHYDLARAGAALYGIEGPRGIQRVLRLRAPVMQIKELRKGESIGYNALWLAPRKTRIATIALGYADGLARTTPPGTPLWCDNTPLPIRGRISMDMASVEINNAPQLQVGSLVDILPPPAGATPTEIPPLAYTRTLTCEMGTRLRRVYRQNGKNRPQ